MRPTSYPLPARVLHWVMALCVLAVIPLGLAMGAAEPGPLQNTLFDLHRSMGVLILVLIVLRFVNRLAGGVPKTYSDVPAWQRIAARIVHDLLYLLLLVEPLLGWIATSAYGATIRVFWLFDLPAITAKNEPLSEALFEVHETLAWVIVALVVVHIAAALYHHFVARDRVLVRMWTGAA